MSDKKILVLDDDKDTLFFMSEILREYPVVAMSNPFDALNLLTSGDFSLVIADYKIPGLDGINLYRALKESYGPRLPFGYFMISGCIEETFIKDALNLGIDELFIKPIDGSQLRTIVARFFSKK